MHITATCGHVNVNIARHYIVVCTSQYCHSHIQMYIVYISIHSLFLLLQHSCTFIISILFMCMSVFFFTYFALSWHSMWTAKKEFHCTGKLAFLHCAHDNKRFESFESLNSCIAMMLTSKTAVYGEGVDPRVMPVSFFATESC